MAGAELPERFVQSEDVGGPGQAHLGGGFERKARHPIRVLLAPRMLDEHPSHHQGGDGEEVRAVLPAHLVLAKQPQKGLVDQGSGLEDMPLTLPAQVAGRELSQLAVDEGSEAVEGLAIASAPGSKQARERPSGHRGLPRAI